MNRLSKQLAKLRDMTAVTAQDYVDMLVMVETMAGFLKQAAADSVELAKAVRDDYVSLGKVRDLTVKLKESSARFYGAADNFRESMNWHAQLSTE